MEERQRLVEEYRSSGKSVVAFGREKGVAYTTLCTWLQKSGLGDERKTGKIRLKTVNTSPLFSAGETTSAAIVEIICGSTTVRLYRDR